MGCETCQDCSCDSITLPIALGDTGPAGPAGDPGADGADGSVILFNNVTPATTASQVAVDLSGMTYTLPADQLATVGDQIKLKSYFNTTDQKGSSIDIFVDGTSCLFPVNFGRLSGGRGNLDLRTESIFTRTSATNLTVEHFFMESDPAYGNLMGARQIFSATVPVTGLTATTTIFKLKGSNVTAAETLTCYYMSVEFLNKA